jgi:hypothetical protein
MVRGGGNYSISSTFKGSTMIPLVDMINPKRCPEVTQKCTYEDSNEFDNVDTFQRQGGGVTDVALSCENEL